MSLDTFSGQQWRQALQSASFHQVSCDAMALPEYITTNKGILPALEQLRVELIFDLEKGNIKFEDNEKRETLAELLAVLTHMLVNIPDDVMGEATSLFYQNRERHFFEIAYLKGVKI